MLLETEHLIIRIMPKAIGMHQGAPMVLAIILATLLNAYFQIPAIIQTALPTVMTARSEHLAATVLQAQVCQQPAAVQVVQVEALKVLVQAQVQDVVVETN